MGKDSNARIKLRASVLTDVGLVRDHNEDWAYIDEDQRYFIVADGMGGHAAGEIASAMAVGTVSDALKSAAGTLGEFAAHPSEDGRRQAVTTLEAAVRGAHQAVYERGLAEADKQGMGTTLDVVMVAGPEAFMAHVGDSRTYLLRDGKAAQITTDHTVAEVLVIEGKLTLEEAQVSPLRTILVNAIGVAPDVGVEMAHVQLRKGDLLLLCSDGLHDYFPIEQELADHIIGHEPADALQALTDLAKERGGHDNITGIIVEVLECDAGGMVETPRGLEMSDGVPGRIDRDDTLPVDVGEEDGPAPHRRTDPAMKSVSPTDDTLDHPAAPDDGTTLDEEE
ncbi:MAG TPA: protein phosphatase 2C domain-containing protein [Kofleriaceae bacterium]|nr:protein phosphatase 2C domain-containing protein [Kofleriaceae bacterium]